MYAIKICRERWDGADDARRRAIPEKGQRWLRPPPMPGYTPRMRLRYELLCALIGLALGWVPMFLHGPIPEKFNLYYLRGAISVWSWYTARLLIGFMVGITCWPRRWYLRGPMCGFLMMLPPGIMSLSVPTCGPVCMFWNETTATSIGLIVAGLAFWLTGRNHALDAPSRPRDASPDRVV